MVPWGNGAWNVDPETWFGSTTNVEKSSWKTLILLWSFFDRGQIHLVDLFSFLIIFPSFSLEASYIPFLSSETRKRCLFCQQFLPLAPPGLHELGRARPGACVAGISERQKGCAALPESNNWRVKQCTGDGAFLSLKYDYETICALYWEDGGLCIHLDTVNSVVGIQ